jgi:L-malate glycosyltransferase
VRVLHVVDTPQLRGAEVFASDLVRALNEQSVSQRVAVLRPGGSGRVRFDAPVHLLGSNGRMTPGLRIHAQALRALRRLVREWRPNIVQAHGGSTLKYSIPAALGLPTRVVYRHIGPTPSRMFGYIKRAGYGVLMGRVDRVVAVGESVRRNALEVLRVPGGRVVTIPNAVDSQRIRPTAGREAVRHSLDIPVASPVVLSLGALTWEKNPVAHVDIGARVLHQRPDAIHLLVGDGPMRQEVEASIHRRGLEGQMLMLGARPDVADLFAASDVLLFASRPDGMESMNASVIEAGMLGIPAVGYAVGGVPEVIVEGTTGYLIPAGDVDGLAARVLQLLANPEKRRVMGVAAREHCLARFDIRSIAPKYLELYEELMS